MAQAKRAGQSVLQQYHEQYARSVQQPDTFWGEVATRIDWIKPFTTVKNVSFDPNALYIEWFGEGQLNACANCVDRHLKTRAYQPAIIWEPDTPGPVRTITYAQLHDAV